MHSHSHMHPHSHTHSHTHDDLSNAEANRVFWDAAATSFYDKVVDVPKIAQMYDDVTTRILASTPFDPEKTTLMDFACGNGAFAERLAPHCKSIVGVDISQVMADSFNARMRDRGIKNTTALSTELTPNDPLLTGEKFDVIFCSQSYKHIQDNVAITRVLKSYLKPRGALLIVEVSRGKDAALEVMDMQSVMNNVPVARPKNLMSHMGGYAEEDMRAIIEEAGLVEFTYEDVFEKSQDGKSFALFLVTGICPE